MMNCQNINSILGYNFINNPVIPVNKLPYINSIDLRNNFSTFGLCF